MSKIIYACFRDASQCNANVERRIETIAKRVSPDNITPRPPKIYLEDNVIFGIINPSNSIQVKDKSVLLGMAYGNDERWWKPGEAHLDGSFSLFRSDSDRSEIITDIVGSRSVWYYHDDKVFIASSSQRSIVMMLGSFQPDRAVIPWMLSAGSLGPFLSWDKRIKLLPPNSSVSLDHSSWQITVDSTPVCFNSVSAADKEHETLLKSALTDTFKSLKIDFTKWVLPLSGGYDSRGMLSLFHLIGSNLKNLKAITWGLAKSIKEPGNDALIAKKLAEHYRIQHTYYPTDLSEETVESIFHRFLICGEGRIDHIGGYMDGFAIWKTLFDNQIEGIIRGDVPFSAKASDSVSDIRKVHGFPLCNDFANLNEDQGFEFARQTLPSSFEQLPNESLDVTRDRLYHQFRLPIVLAALNDLKLSYVEVINPLMSKPIVEESRRLPDHLRTDKELFKRIVRSISPPIGYATSSALADSTFLLKSKRVVDHIRSELNTESCRAILPKAFTSYLTDNLVVENSSVNRKKAIKSFLKRYLPYSLIRQGTKLTASKNVAVNTLAFRVYIISRMNRLLAEDAAVFEKSESF